MNNSKKPKVELLSPAGSFAALTAVVNAGADAAYGAGNRFGARAYAENFSEEELLKAIDFMHLRDKRFYLTVNTLQKENELTGALYDYIKPLYAQGLDGVIVQDLGVLSFLNAYFPDMEFHASTQMTITGAYGAKLMKNSGCSRIVTARELSLEEIRDIHEKVDIEIESFIHGALCFCYSGQCLFSSMLGGRSGNRGRCAQPCRLPYEASQLSQEKYLLSPKDLCTIALLPQIIASGVDALKIEGRMKQTDYAAGVTHIYRNYLDQYLCNPKDNYEVSRTDLQRLADFGSRSGFTKGYYTAYNGSDMMSLDKPAYTKAKPEKQEQVALPNKLSNQEVKEKMNGILILSKYLPAKLVLKCKEREITVMGDTVEKAKNRPLDIKSVEDKMRKTGSSAFFFETLEIKMEHDVFIPISSLNQLRRKGLDKLTKSLTENFHRHNDPLPQITSSECFPKATFSYLAISIESLSQYKVLLHVPFVSRIYVDGTAFSKDKSSGSIELKKMVSDSHAFGKQVYYMMPHIFRKSTADWYKKNRKLLTECDLDGFVIRNVDELEFFKDMKLKGAAFLSDSNLYTWSKESCQFLKRNGIHTVTLPLELNQRELRERRYEGGELIIYGHIPLMISTQCLVKNIEGCKQEKKTIFIKDRYDKKFPVKNQCDYCYNIIYNSVPISLLHQPKKVMEIAPEGLRISFTGESTQQMERILKLYEASYLKGEILDLDRHLQDFTNGHLKRGVE